jgi:hypothetical protein
MSSVICKALFGELSVPPSETRGPVAMSRELSYNERASNIQIHFPPFINGINNVR